MKSLLNEKYEELVSNGTIHGHNSRDSMGMFHSDEMTIGELRMVEEAFNDVLVDAIRNKQFMEAIDTLQEELGRVQPEVMIYNDLVEWNNAVDSIDYKNIQGDTWYDYPNYFDFDTIPKIMKDKYSNYEWKIPQEEEYVDYGFEI